MDLHDTSIFQSKGIAYNSEDLKFIIEPESDGTQWSLKLICKKIELELDFKFKLHDSMTWA
jgi:hypothetical protein